MDGAVFRKKRIRFRKEEGAVLGAELSSSTFTPLSRLPMELRIKIWDCCIEPQVLDIWSHDYHKSEISTAENAPVAGDRSLARGTTRPYKGRYAPSVVSGLFVITSERIPIMHICRESRPFAQG